MPHLLPVYQPTNYSFERGQGVYLYDFDGGKYLDFAAGIAVNSMGHCHPHLVQALQKQAAKLWHVSNLYVIDGAEALAKRIADASKFAHYVFFCNSGAEAVECGLKMIRKYQKSIGHYNKFRVITFEGAFHGRTLATISAAKKDKLLKGFEPAADGFDLVKWGDLDAVKNAIGPDTAGILIEPVQGEGGIRPATPEFLQGLRKIADDNGLVLMFDGVQCGMGRTGKFFSHEWAGVYPDITSSAKGIGGGFPLGACLSTKKLGDCMDVGSHGSTYANNPLAMAVGNAVMDLMLAPGFFDHVIDVSTAMFTHLENLKTKYSDVIVDVRGKGLMLGIKFADKVDVKYGVEALKKRGLLTATAGDNVIRMVPPLIITKGEAQEGLEIIESWLKTL